MDVAVIKNSALRIKSKRALLVVDPEVDMPKTSCDGVLFLNTSHIDPTKASDYRVIIDGAGEYETGGLKIAGFRFGENLVYDLNVDNLDVVLARSSGLEKIIEKIKEGNVLILNVDSEINQSVVTSLEPSVVILYGERAKEGAKTLGKEVSSSPKYSVSEDKLPEEMQVVLLE